MEAPAPNETFDIRSTGTVTGASLGDVSQHSESRRGSVVLQPNMAPVTREFQFVDVKDTGSRKQARSHVMRQYLREKRKQQSARLETSLHPGNSSAFTPLQWQKRDHASTSHEFDELQLELRPRSFDSTSESEDELPPSSLSSIASEDIVPYHRRLPPPSPQTLMSASRKDPFASFPLSLDDSGHELTDIFVRIIPGLVFRADVRATYLFNPIRDVLFKEAMTNPLVFQSSVLAFTAGYRARWYGFKETDESRRNKTKAVSLVNETVRQPSGKLTGGSIMAVTSLAHYEDRWGSSELAHEHLEFAQRMMKERWDMTLPRPRHPCETWLHFLHYTMDPKPKTEPNPSNRELPLASCLRNFYRLMLFHREKFSRLHKRFAIFDPEMPLHGVFSPVGKTDKVPEEQFVFLVLQRLNVRIRLSALLYIHFALWDHRESLEDAESLLAHLERTVSQHEIDRFPSCSLLLWVMMDGEDEPELGDPARAWRVGDVLNEAKKLIFEKQESLSDFLLALLSGTDPETTLPYWENELAST